MYSIYIYLMVSLRIPGLWNRWWWDASHIGHGELLDPLDLIVRQGVEVAYDAWAVPLVLLQYGLQYQPGVPVAIMITAEQAAPPLVRLQNSRCVMIDSW